MSDTRTTIGTLPNRPGSVILTDHGKVMVLMPGMYSQHHWQTPNSLAWWSPIVDWLPATVLHEGGTK
jgi:hypothetical protein